MKLTHELLTAWRVQRDQIGGFALSTAIVSTCEPPDRIDEARKQEAEPKDNLHYKTAFGIIFWPSLKTTICTDAFFHFLSPERMISDDQY